MNWQSSPPTRLEAHYGDRVVACFTERPANVDRLLRDAAARDPGGEALVDGARRFAYRDLDRMATEVAAGLAARGVAAGDRVALLLGNRAEFAFALFGALRAGAVVVPLNIREQKPELEFVLANCGAKALVHEADLVARLPDPETVPALLHRIAVGGEAKGSEPFDALLQPGVSVPPLDVDEEACAVIVYTSGTTGKPKGAMLTHLSLGTSVIHYRVCWDLTRADRAMMAVPGTHVTGLIAILLSMVHVGGATILLPVFKAATFLALAAAERMTYTLMVPAMYNLCLLQAEFDHYDLSAWRVGGYGGSPMPLATFDTLAEKLPRLALLNAYGSTETASPSSLTPPGLGKDKADTVGRPVPCAEIRIMDDSGREVPQGESGEIWIKGAQVAPGYWDNPQATAAGFTAGFWHSGDIGAFTEDGYLRVFDRKKDMINRAGYKVYSAEVENVLMQHPNVGEAAVIPEPDPVLGEKVHAHIFVKGGSLTLEEVRSFCQVRLSDYKVPDFVTFVDEPLPRNAAGKILKRALRPHGPKAREA